MSAFATGEATDASRLLTALSQILASRKRKLVAVLTIRTEFVPALERNLAPGLRLKHRPLVPIAALSDVIEKPAARFGIELEAGLASKMVEETEGAGALPLLAYTLRELYEKYGDDKRLTINEYKTLGGVEGAIAKKVHEALTDPKPDAAELAALRRALVRHLVRVDETAVEGERYLRTVVSRDIIPEEGRRLIGRLEDVRLLYGDADNTIAIAHDRLINNWPMLPIKDWLIADRDDRKLIANLHSRFAEHQEGGPFLREKSLLDAKDLLFRDGSLRTEEEELVRFIERSAEQEEVEKTARLKAAEEREKSAQKIARRTGYLVFAMGIAAIIAIAAAIITYQQYEEIQSATLRLEEGLRLRNRPNRAFLDLKRKMVSRRN